jgi:hypothetical protein
MHQIVAKRLPPELAGRLADRTELVDALALAAFGMPRGFLNMLSTLLSVGETDPPKPTRQRAERAISDHADTVRSIFKALANKLPRFRHFIDVGGELEDAMLSTLRGYNKLQLSPGKKSAVVGLEEPLGPELERMLNMLEYAGLLRKAGTVSRGVKGRFVKYLMNYASVVAENALSLGKSYALPLLTASLRTSDAHSFARTKGTALLGAYFERRCSLDLPPCKKCRTRRISEEQRFCMKCGAELTDVSVYEELLRAPIDRLPLTANKIAGIKQYTRIRTVQDLLIDDERQEIRKVPYVGRLWAARIRTYAEEFVGV